MKDTYCDVHQNDFLDISSVMNKNLFKLITLFWLINTKQNLSIIMSQQATVDVNDREKRRDMYQKNKTERRNITDNPAVRIHFAENDMKKQRI